MNTKNIFCSNHGQVPGDQAAVINCTCSNTFLAGKNWHITKQAVAQTPTGSEGPQDGWPAWWLITTVSKAQPGHKVRSAPHRRAGFRQLSADWAAHTTEPVPLMGQCGHRKRHQVEGAAFYSKGSWCSLFISQSVKRIFSPVLQSSTVIFLVFTLGKTSTS